MSNKIIKGSFKLGEAIKKRRQELGLTLEEAASKADIALKSWCRYENGESIRSDKAKSICKVLNWKTLLDEDGASESNFNLSKYKKHKAWSKYLCEAFGEAVAIAFVAGSDIVLDNIEEDLSNLSSMPRGSHLGQLELSMMQDDLPSQFLMRYDYDFLYRLRNIVVSLRASARSGEFFQAHSVIEEIAIYMFMQEALFYMETMLDEMQESRVKGLDLLEDWAFDMFDDMDVYTMLYSKLLYLNEDDDYHFNNWFVPQFFISE